MRKLSAKTASVLEYMETHRGKDVHVQVIAAALHMTSRDVNNGLGALLSRNQVEHTGHGRWRFKEPAAVAVQCAGDLYECIGTGQDGALILRSASGALGKFMPL